MTSLQRIGNVFLGLLMIALSIFLLLYPHSGFRMVADLLCIALLLSGIRFIIYYLRMGRYMVEGTVTLIEGILLIDVSIFGLMLSKFPASYLIVYLLGVHAFSGGVEVLNAFQAKGLDTPWKGKMLHGIINLLVAASCVYYGFVKKDKDMLVYIYASGLLYSAAVRIVNAFRKTAIVYIQ